MTLRNLTGRIRYLGLFLMVAALGNAAPQKTISDLALGKTVETELSGNRAGRYRLSLVSGQYARVVVMTRGMAIVATVRGPSGSQMTRRVVPSDT